MFKLFKDSIFNPKNIIHYRAKSAGFTILYSLLVSLILALSLLINPIQYTELELSEKITIAETFQKYNCYLKNGTFYSNESFTIDVFGYSFGFIKTNGTSNDLKNDLPSFMIMGDTIYTIIEINSNNYKEIAYEKIVDVNENFKNLTLTQEEDLNKFYSSANEIIKEVKPLIIGWYFIVGLISGMTSMFLMALILYLIMQLLFKAKKYMRNGQLYKMLVFSTTGSVIGSAISALAGQSLTFSIIIFAISYIPTFLLLREFANRIRMREVGNGIVNNPSFINKMNEIIKKKQDEENENKNDKNDDKNE